MAKQKVQLTFTFDNPNTPKTFERQLQKILIDKLLSQNRDSRKEPPANENSSILSCLDGQG